MRDAVVVLGPTVADLALHFGPPEYFGCISQQDREAANFDAVAVEPQRMEEVLARDPLFAGDPRRG